MLESPFLEALRFVDADGVRSKLLPAQEALNERGVPCQVGSIRALLTPHPVKHTKQTVRKTVIRIPGPRS